jgi:hypothetical protein
VLLLLRAGTAAEVHGAKNTIAEELTPEISRQVGSYGILIDGISVNVSESE